MTRILLTVFVIFSCSFIANAQFSKGSILLGGQLAFGSVKINNPVYISQEQKYSSGIFSVSIGKAIKGNAVFGINLSYSPFSYNYYYTNNGIGPADYSNDNYSIAVFYRFYKNLGKDFYLFGEAGGSYIGSTSSAKDKSGNKLLTGSGSGGNLYFMPGISYQMSKKFLLELTIPSLFLASHSTQKSTVTGQQASTSDQFNISTSLSSNPLTSLGIGFRLVL